VKSIIRIQYTYIQYIYHTYIYIYIVCKLMYGVGVLRYMYSVLKYWSMVHGGWKGRRKRYFLQNSGVYDIYIIYICVIYIS
jgi:hypothetical protein